MKGGAGEASPLQRPRPIVFTHPRIVTHFSMNRTIVIVKAKPHEFRVIRVFWDEGQAIARWLLDLYPDHNAALRLISQGHRHTITEPHRIVCPEYEWFRTLTNARTWTEHTTLAYHNGKRWQFWHHGDRASTLQGCALEVGV